MKMIFIVILAHFSVNHEISVSFLAASTPALNSSIHSTLSDSLIHFVFAVFFHLQT